MWVLSIGRRGTGVYAEYKRLTAEFTEVHRVFEKMLVETLKPRLVFPVFLCALCGESMMFLMPA